MKALKLIKECLDVDHTEVKEAISELEALQQRINSLEAENAELKDTKIYETCDGCVHFGVRDGYKTCRSIHQCGIWYPNLKDVGNV